MVRILVPPTCEISYNGQLEIHKALPHFVLRERPRIELCNYKSCCWLAPAKNDRDRCRPGSVIYTDGKLNIYDSPLGVMTNSPAFDWQMTNLRNYVIFL
jgi:hypothetical protein